MPGRGKVRFLPERGGNMSPSYHEKQAQKTFSEALSEVTGVKYAECYQCGKCSAGCPAAFAAAADRWDLTLHPLDRQLQGLFEQLAIRGRGDLITRLEIEEPNGDRQSTQLQVISRRPAAPSAGP